MTGLWPASPSAEGEKEPSNSSPDNKIEGALEYMFFLFTDVLLFALPKKKGGVDLLTRKKKQEALYEYRGFFLLTNATVVDVPDRAGMCLSSLFISMNTT